MVIYVVALFSIKKYVFSMADVKNKWEKSSWGRKLIVQKRRASLNDFDRFKVMLAKIKVCSFFLKIVLAEVLFKKQGSS